MKDRSKLVTLVALLALVVAFASMEGGLPGIDLFGDSLFWVLWGVLLFYMVRGGGCCSRAKAETSADSTDSTSD